MQKIFHPAHTRGSADFGWLKANYSFSFANYFNPNRLQFGALRVLNDDTIDGGMGFGTHPHQNMEIITIPLAGALQHKDSMGNEGIIHEGEVQVMSAGTGVEHSEFNGSKTEKANTLQIWVFTETENVTPRYDQKKFSSEERHNKLLPVVTPKNDNDGNALWVHQQTYFNLGNIDAGKKIVYQVHQKNHGVYIFLISGEIKIEGETLQKRDALGVWEINEIEIEVNEDARILLMEVPME
ncbi:pirin family protein [Mesonia aestuariivivens]|uniref:Pirin family protein n=1 Tax=Mesonia aestuariivivens TaxID=2796128 RepID=A0ABS6W0V9_9FLAO|nr:pirin family protein [Mesonia aestuariivivens]MBW2961493.1 pirin family protein [Mesonia aestuariivivens]